MSDILDEDDFDILKRTWLNEAYPDVIAALQNKKSGLICVKNNVYRLFHKVRK